MKRTLLILMALMLSLSVAGAALAASASNPPKSICLSDGYYVYSLSIKLNGTVNMQGGPVKYYAITGELYGGTSSIPLSGAGHVKNGVFHFTLTGTDLWGSPNLYTHVFEGKWTLATSTGTCAWRQLIETSGVVNTSTSIISADLTIVDCTTIVLPYNAQGE